MAWRVSLTAPAEADVDEAFERIRKAAPMHAEKPRRERYREVDFPGI